MEVYPGQIVCSKAGRDKGKYFLIMKIINSDYVYVIDGHTRRIDNPKKKKVKHLLFTNQEAADIKEKIDQSKKITNAQVKKSLMAFRNVLEQTE